MNPSQPLKETPKPASERREVRRRAKRVFSKPTREIGGAALVFGMALLIVGLMGNPWNRPWMALNDVVVSADDFVLSQGQSPGNYMLARTVRYRPDGLWSAYQDSAAFMMRPTFAHRICLYRRGWDDWTLELNQNGRVISLLHNEEDDAPGEQLSLEEARSVLSMQIDSILALPRDELVLIAESLIVRPQRNDYFFEFEWSEALTDSQRLQVIMAGEYLAGLSIVEDSVRVVGTIWPWGKDGELWQRWAGVLLIFLGAFVLFLRHRAPLAWGPAAFFGIVTLIFFLSERLLRIHFYEMASIAGLSFEGELKPIVLGVLIEAVQAALIIGLVVGTGESLSKTWFRKVATITRLGSPQRDWSTAWASAARLAVPWAIVILVIEWIVSRSVGPSGLMRVAAEQTAYVLSAPVLGLSATLQTLLHAIWHETIFRLWALAILVSQARSRIVAVIVSASLATVFGCVGTTFGWHQCLWFFWAVVATILALRHGIRAAFLLHLLVLGGHTSLLLLWTGLPEGGWAGGIFVGMLLLGLFSIGVWRENTRRFAS